MPIDRELLELLACPADRGALRETDGRLVCVSCGRRYPIRESVPVLLIEEAESPGS